MVSVAGVALLALLLSACAETTTSGAWQQLGPLDGQRVVSLAQDPVEKHLVYVGASNGLVYRLRADTSTTLAAGEGLPKDTAIPSLLPDPQRLGTVYAATDAGFYVSTDYGDTWRARGAGLPRDETFGALIFGDDTQTLFAGSAQHGIYVSHDLGGTWQQSSAGLAAHASVPALLLEPSKHILYAAVDGTGVYASSDAGQHWIVRTTGLPQHVYALTQLPTHGLASQGPTLYAGTSAGVYTSGDGGQRWSLASPSFTAANVRALLPALSVAGGLYAGSETGVYTSTDGGATWHLTAPGLKQAVTSLVIVPNAGHEDVALAGGDHLLRYPAYAPRNPDSPFGGSINLLVLIVLIGVGGYALVRAQRNLRALDRASRAPQPTPQRTPTNEPRRPTSK